MTPTAIAVWANGIVCCLAVTLVDAGSASARDDSATKQVVRELLRKEVSLQDGDWYLVLRERRIEHVRSAEATEVPIAWQLFEMIKAPLHTGKMDPRKSVVVWRIGGQLWSRNMPDFRHRWDVEADRDSQVAYLVHSTMSGFVIYVIDLTAQDNDEVRIDEAGALVGRTRVPTMIRLDPRLRDRMETGIAGHVRIRLHDGKVIVLVQRVNGTQQEYVYHRTTGKWQEVSRGEQQQDRK